MDFNGVNYQCFEVTASVEYPFISRKHTHYLRPVMCYIKVGYQFSTSLNMRQAFFGIIQHTAFVGVVRQLFN